MATSAVVLRRRSGTILHEEPRKVMATSRVLGAAPGATLVISLALAGLAAESRAQVTWLPRSPALSPAPRQAYALAYDAHRGRVVLFGGSDVGGPLAETWEWDGATSGWLELAPAVSLPARREHAMAYDVARRRVVLFGGNGRSGLLADTWEWDGASWTQRTPAIVPPARQGHA